MTHFFNTEIAMKFHDANVATIFSNLCYWIAHNKANKKNEQEIEIDGKKVLRTFTYNSISAFCELFPYFTKRQIENYLNKLREANLIYKSNFNSSGYDRTSWYCLVDESYLGEHLPQSKQSTPPIPQETPENTQVESTPISNDEEETEKNNESEIEKLKKGNAFHQTGKWTSPNGEMDFPKMQNGFPQNVEPIPNINTNLNKITTTTKLKTILLEVDLTFVFDDKFYEAAAVFLDMNYVDDIKGYASWLYDQVQTKKPNNLKNYFYSVFLLKENVLSYKGFVSKIKNNKRKAITICPVCGDEIDRNSAFCPKCEFNIGYITREDEIRKHKAIISLPPEKLKEYKKELSQIYSEKTIFQQISAKIELQKKYGILE